MNCRSESRKRRMTLQQHYPGGSPTWKKIGQPCSCIAICGMYIESLNHCKIFLTQTMRIRSIPSATMNSEKNRFWPIIAKPRINNSLCGVLLSKSWKENFQLTTVLSQLCLAHFASVRKVSLASYICPPGIFSICIKFRDFAGAFHWLPSCFCQKHGYRCPAW